MYNVCYNLYETVHTFEHLVVYTYLTWHEKKIRVLKLVQHSIKKMY